MGRIKKILRLSVLVIVLLIFSGCDNSANKGYEQEKQDVQNKIADQENKQVKQNNSSSQPTQKPESKPKSETEPENKSNTQQVQLSYEDWLRDTITKAIGEETNNDKPRIESIFFYDKEKTDMEICLWANDNLTPGLIKDGILMESTDILRQIFSDKRAQKALLYWQFPANDTPGQEKNMVLMQVKMTRETASKINWSEFNPLDLPETADNCNINPSLQ